MDFNFKFDTQALIKDAEEQILKAFKNATDREIKGFFSENEYYREGKLITISGAGLLLIREFLQKKFDDPNTQDRMEKFFEANFDRLMEEAMQKAIQHKANAFVFAKVKEK